MTWNQRIVEVARQLVALALNLVGIFTDLIRVLATKLDEAVDELAKKAE